MPKVFFVSKEFKKEARKMRPDAIIRVDHKLKGDNCYAITGGCVPMKGTMPKPWRRDGR